jgi:hypothetical protein
VYASLDVGALETGRDRLAYLEMDRSAALDEPFVPEPSHIVRDRHDR